MTEGIKPPGLVADATENAASSAAEQAEVEALLPAFAWGATDMEETALVMANLAHQPAAALAMEQFSALHQAMLFSAPPIQAPAHLAQRLQAALGHSVAPGANTGNSAQSAPSTRQRVHWWQTLTNLLAPYNWALAPTAAVAAVALLAVNGYSFRQNQQNGGNGGTGNVAQQCLCALYGG
jgi:hypothetical protein